MKTLNLFIILFSIITNQLLGQEIGVEKKIHSNILNEDRIYYISTPDNYTIENNQAYPVLYVLDGNELFKLASSSVNFLANRGFMPQTIVIGINNRNHRDRDLTPTKSDWSPTGGGAENFLSFLTDELMPEIEKNYKTQPHKTIYGSSLGGLFSMYVLYNHPEKFNNYIAVSPSLYHDNGLLFNHALSYFDNPKTGDKKFVFLSLADEVYSEMRINFRSTINLFKSKANSKNIRWSYKVYDTETHETSKLVGLNDGLRSLHEFWFVPFYQRDRGAEGLLDHYNLLNDLYGFKDKIEIPQSLVNRIGYNILREGKPEMALTLFKYNVEHFPNSPNSYDSLAEYYEKQKKYTDAKKYYELALNMSKKQNIDATYYEQSVKRIVEYLKK